MKYDDVSWHRESDFPEDLPAEAGATHIGMFLAWALLRDLGSDGLLREAKAELQKLRKRKTTPGRFAWMLCEGELTDEHLCEEGNRFAADYLHYDEGTYLTDYSDLADDLPSLYHVPDTWETFDELAPMIDARFAAWQRTGSAKSA